MERQKWLSSLDGMYPSKLRKLRDDLKASFRAARKEEAKKVWQWRIDAVEERLLGGKVEDSPKPPEVVQVSTFSEETRQYLRDQAQHLINLGKGDQLTAA